MITLTQLEYVVAVDEFRHFATAADKCFVTQPTLSMQIKKLEDDLGVIIFDRSRQPVVPTDIGYKLIEQARTVLASAQRRETGGGGIPKNRYYSHAGSLFITDIHRGLHSSLSRGTGGSGRINFGRDYPTIET